MDDLISFALPSKGNVASSPQLVVPIEVSDNHHIHQSIGLSSCA
jgi:hypothetical protein